jgi:hypothetical protein
VSPPIGEVSCNRNLGFAEGALQKAFTEGALQKAFTEGRRWGASFFGQAPHYPRVKGRIFLWVSAPLAHESGSGTTRTGWGIAIQVASMSGFPTSLVGVRVLGGSPDLRAIS